MFPKFDVLVVATIEHWNTKETQLVDLIHVNEDDVTWRTADDNSELSYDYNVINWKYKE